VAVTLDFGNFVVPLGFDAVAYKRADFSENHTASIFGTEVAMLQTNQSTDQKRNQG
jgi:hypothetical protein